VNNGYYWVFVGFNPGSWLARGPAKTFFIVRSELLNIDSDFLKTKLLFYWRFKRGYYYCATEVNTGKEIADVMLCNDKEIIEIEVKITFSDFIADFKKPKHYIHQANKREYHYLKSNKFFFCVHPDISDRCKTYLDENNYQYGLITFRGKLIILKSCRKLKKIDTREFNFVKNEIIRRATSELVNLREAKTCQLK